MGRRKLEKTTDTTNPNFWVAWCKTALRDIGEDKFVYGWLPGTMTEQEISALKIAAEKLGLIVNIGKKGNGDVYAR
jgi:hypothetical protein